MLAHLAGHRRWSRPQVADNLSPLQRLAVECFEDCRIDHLVLRRYPGLRRVLLALHPRAGRRRLRPATRQCLRHRLACLSRALLDPAHGYRDPTCSRFVAALPRPLARAASPAPPTWPRWRSHGRHARAARATSRPGALRRHAW